MNFSFVFLMFFGGCCFFFPKKHVVFFKKKCQLWFVLSCIACFVHATVTSLELHPAIVFRNSRPDQMASPHSPPLPLHQAFVKKVCGGAIGSQAGRASFFRSPPRGVSGIGVGSIIACILAPKRWWGLKMAIFKGKLFGWWAAGPKTDLGGGLLRLGTP